jgi:hypothetical protein
LIPPNSQPDPQTLATIKEKIEGGEMVGIIHDVVANLLQQFRSGQENVELYAPDNPESAPSGAEFNQGTYRGGTADSRPSLPTSGDSDSLMPQTRSSVVADGTVNSGESENTAYSANFSSSVASPIGNMDFTNANWPGISSSFNFSNISLLQTSNANVLPVYTSPTYPPMTSMELDPYSQAHETVIPNTTTPTSFRNPFSATMGQIPHTNAVHQQIHPYQATQEDQFRRFSSPDEQAGLQQPQQFYTNLPNRSTAIPNLQNIPTTRGVMLTSQPLQPSLLTNMGPGTNMPESFFNMPPHGQQNAHIAQANMQHGFENMPPTLDPEDLNLVSPYDMMVPNPNWQMQ